MEELYEYKNLGVLKNYVGSFSSNIDDNIDKTRKKCWYVIFVQFWSPESHPLIYVKFWRQACLPTLLYDAELFTLTPTSLLRLERCHSWFLKNIFYIPKFAPEPLLLTLSCLNSVESEIATRRLLLLGHLPPDKWTENVSCSEKLVRQQNEKLLWLRYHIIECSAQHCRGTTQIWAISLLRKLAWQLDIPDLFFLEKNCAG